MMWSYGVTTVKQRIDDGLLLRTLNSLAAGGFPSPRLFIDGPADIPEWMQKYEITHHIPRLRTFGNWITAAWELYIRMPNAERYAIFQDDFVTYRNLRAYLEQSGYTEKSYKNLYTFPENQKEQHGWYPSPNQRGLGAVALVFDGAALRTLLAAKHLVNRPLDAHRGHRAVDGGIVDSMRQAGYKEYVHNPSLVQHTGKKSTMGNGRHPQADTFLGEEFDARRLLRPKTEANGADAQKGHPVQPRTNIAKGSRIGLVGYNCATGLGELNRQLATYCKIDVWLVKPHPKLPSCEPHPDVETITCPKGSAWRIEEFLNKVDTVLFAEQPYYDNLPALAVQHGKRLVCIPMMEWMPAGAKGWPQMCELLCPTAHCYGIFAHVAKCREMPWPVDTQRFKFQPRYACTRFLFVEGHGGWQGRTGGAVIRQALELWPEMPLIVRSQVPNSWPAKFQHVVAGATKENFELYTEGDVLICPHSVDGLGLEPMEALACGMPVITTDGKPWTELPALARIPCKIEDRKVRRPVKWHLPDAKALVEICKGLLGKPLRTASEEALQWAQSRSWDKQAETFNQAIRGENVAAANR